MGIEKRDKAITDLYNNLLNAHMTFLGFSAKLDTSGQRGIIEYLDGLSDWALNKAKLIKQHLTPLDITSIEIKSQELSVINHFSTEEILNLVPKIQNKLVQDCNDIVVLELEFDDLGLLAYFKLLSLDLKNKYTEVESLFGDGSQILTIEEISRSVG